ncbi:MAG: peptidoglycan DD-metalloendopeptidase family protein [Legionellaceae bacterium]|nr:peptidoglycan DD-metalloendopeptidase family protein [Legionellaceae bacterium]
MNASLLILILCVCLSTNGYASSTKTQLQRLEERMRSIKKQLYQDESSRDKLYKKLAQTEKEMSHDLHALHLLTPKEKQKKQDIQSITQNIETLNQQLKTQELILANHVRARHKLGAIHPWQWLLHQETPKTMSRLFVFYQYLFQADKHVIEQVRKTSQQLLTNQNTLSSEQRKLLALQKKLTLRQKRLAIMKQEQQHLIDTLNQKIQTKTEQLKTYHNDKARLQSLVRKLSIRPQTKLNTPKLKLEGKRLSSPLDKPSKQTKPLNQGLVFLATEGTPVLSVLPGKVIFSDWLKGYGLLLIIDHGNGVMSLYAHNASLFKTLGNTVKQGEQIATVGHTGGLRENGLYFEVRRRGRAVPPREWMS